MSTRPEAGKPQRWWPRAGWGTVRDYKAEDNGNGRVNITLRFVPDDGSKPQLIKVTNTVPIEGIGEYARGTYQDNFLNIRVSVEGLAKAEAVFQRINQLKLAERQSMFASHSDLAGDAGWAWMPDYTLVKVARGLLD